MTPQYNPELPGERDGDFIPLTIASTALAKSNFSNVDTVQTINPLDVDTTLIEVNAIGAGVFLKYAAGATSSDFDEYIQEGQTRHYVRPSGVTVVSLIGRTSGGSAIVIQK